MKHLLRRILCLTFIFSLMSMFSFQPVFAAEYSNVKSLIIPVGSSYYMLTDLQVQDLVNNTNVTDFILIPDSASVYNNNENNYKTILAPKVVELVNKIIAKRSNAKIWIGTPGITSANYGIASTSLNPFYNYITTIQSSLGSTKWSNNIQGIYMNCESIYGTVNYSNLLGNAVIKLMNDLSYRVHSYLYKKFIWAPYYGYGSNAATIIKNIGYVANTTNIYDFILIQPHYYFDSTVKSNLDGVYYSVQKQSVCYRDGVIVVPKTSSTVIGIDMEGDWHLRYPSSYPDYKARYDEQVNKFSEFRGQIPFTFYVGLGSDGSDLISLTQTYVNHFYNY